MAELPGWTRQRLATADPRDVAAARLMVYARQFRDVLTKDFRQEIADVDESAIENPEAIKRRDRARRARLKEALTQAWRLQAQVRKRLGMEPLDEEAPRA